MNGIYSYSIPSKSSPSVEEIGDITYNQNVKPSKNANNYVRM